MSNNTVVGGDRVREADGVGGTAAAGDRTPPGPTLANGARARAAFEATAADRAALPAAEVIKVNLDVPTTVGTVTSKLRGIAAFMPQIAEELPRYDQAKFAKLETYALALFYAHGAYLVASEPSRSLEELSAEGSQLKQVLMGDAAAQEARGIFGAQHLNAIRTGTGHRDLGEDLIALVNLYRSRWSELQKATGIAQAELEQAEEIAAHLIIEVGERDAGTPLTRNEAIDQRERAFALVIDTYNEARQAIIYLRRKHGDADAIAPSLYSGRGRPRPTAASEEGDGAAPSPAPVEASEAAPSTTEGIPPTTVARTGKVGMPGSRPFAP